MSNSVIETQGIALEKIKYVTVNVQLQLLGTVEIKKNKIRIFLCYLRLQFFLPIKNCML